MPVLNRLCWEKKQEKTWCYCDLTPFFFRENGNIASILLKAIKNTSHNNSHILVAAKDLSIKGMNTDSFFDLYIIRKCISYL